MTGFSFRWYLHDLDKQDVPNVPTWSWALRLIALMLQVAPILRYMDSIRYGVLSRLADWKASRLSETPLNCCFAFRYVKLA